MRLYRAIALVSVTIIASAITACSTTEEAYAPSDVAAALPSQVGQAEKVVLDVDSGDVFPPLAGIAGLYDRDEADWSSAVAMYLEDSGSESGVMIASMRLSGVEASELLGSASTLVGGSATLGSGEIAGREVATFNSFPPFSWAFLYPKGEVLFMAAGRGPDASSISEVLNTLPE